MPASTISVVPIGAKICKPMLLEVMVFSPEAGFKFKVVVERACTPEADEVWKLVFDLFKMIEGVETQIVHISYTAGAPVERAAVQAMASEGVKPEQAQVLATEVHEAAKAVAGKKKVTKKESTRALNALKKTLVPVSISG